MKKTGNKDSRTNSSDEQREAPGIVKMLSNKYFKFGFVAVVYLLWVYWVGNWWLLLGVPVIYDMYVSRKVNWTFWKKRNKPNSKLVEWLDALIFAVIAVTLINIFIFQNYKIPTGSMEKTLQINDHLFVSKLKYGPKIPNTPLSFPFAQHTMPLTTNAKSYLEWIKWPYKRLTGFTKIKNDDIVVFNFPEGDTVLVQYQSEDYHLLKRYDPHILDKHEFTVRPVDKRDNYVKRCVAIPGDTLKIVNTQVYVNGKPQELFDQIQHRYVVQTNGSRINPRTLEKMDIYQADVRDVGNGFFEIPLIDANAEVISKMPQVQLVEKIVKPEGLYTVDVFPHDARYPWNLDNFGPLWIPKKGMTVKIDTSNICLYDRIISAYEGNDLKITTGDIYINGAKADSYTFKMDYYWMMGDNRHDSLDSRYWGFVPEDHIVGAPRFIWLSLNPEKSFPLNIRFGRMFKSAGR